MKLFTGKLFAGLFSLAIIVTCLGGCAQETTANNSAKDPAKKTEKNSPGDSSGSTTGQGPSGVDVPEP